jgi:hypothetical protein
VFRASVCKKRAIVSSERVYRDQILTVFSKPVEDERLSEDIDQLFELTRIIVLVLAGLVPKLTDDKSRGMRKYLSFLDL